MRYEIGDKVKIKTWKEMIKEFEVHQNGNIDCYLTFTKNMEKNLNLLCPDRIITIDSIIGKSYYETKKFRIWSWSDDMIKCLAEDYKEPIPIQSRFEILDL